MIWNEHIECMSREQLRDLQTARLKETVERVYHNTPFYRKKMQELGILPSDIKDIDDIPEEAAKEMRFIPVNNFEDIIKEVF